MRMFLNGMRVELRGRCSVVNYTSLEDLVEKAVVQETCLVEEQKQSKATQPRTGRSAEPQKRTWDQSSVQCHKCGKRGHIARNCRSRTFVAQGGSSAVQTAPAAQTAPVAQTASAATGVAPGACFMCGQFGHYSRYCPTRGPPAKRQAIAPRVYALGDGSGAEPIAGMYPCLFLCILCFGGCYA